MKRWWFGERKHRDEQKLAMKAKARRDIRAFMESGDVVGYLAYISALLQRPLTPEEMEKHTKLFYEQRSVHPSDAWNHW